MSSRKPRAFPTILSKESLVFIGTYTLGKSEGIYVYSWSSGTLEYRSKAVDVTNPSYLAVDPGRRYLFAVNEIRDHDGKLGGGVSSFTIEKNGELKLLSKQPSLGGDPCYIVTDRTGQFVLVSNYASGTVSVLPVDYDGYLSSPTDIVQHIGAGNHPQNPGPHAHCVEVDPTNRYIFVCDAGLDRVISYYFDSGRLEPNAETVFPRGTGPRHITFHPGNEYAYVITESGCTIVAFHYDWRTGNLRELQTVPTLPEGYSERNSCADIHITPDGKYLYGSNRGHDSIVIYAIDKDTGMLSYMGHQSVHSTPRNFAIDPTGAYLLSAGQHTDTVTIFRIDPKTGKLTSTGQVIDVPTPVCIKFIPA